MAKKRADIPKSADAEVLQRIIDRQAIAASASQDQRELSLSDLKFCDINHQWPETIRTQREDDGRPCLTIDRTTPFVNQLANEQRMNRQALKVSPTGDGADKDTAEVIEGMFRHIEYDSDADIAYDRASLSQLRGGLGYFRVYTEYENETSFDQVIKIGSVPNPFMVYTDPSSTSADGSDMNWAMIACDYAAADYKKRWPDSKLANASPAQWESLGDQAPGWIGDGKDGDNVCRVVEYFERVRKSFKLLKLVNGEVVRSDAVEKVPPELIADSRDSFEMSVNWVKANAMEILEETEWPSPWIPIIPVYGQELMVNGRTIYSGLIRQLADIQRMHNYWKSAQTEAIALAPKAPWVAPADSVQGYEQIWRASNRKNYAMLTYNHKDTSGQPIPPPTRDVQEPAIGAITQAIAGTEEDFKAVTGMYDPTLGNRGEASQSGIAIGRLQNQGQVANFHFPDNLNRSRRHLGRIVLGMIPKIYNTQRVVRIVGQDGGSDVVTINAPTKDPKSGVQALFDVTTGTYDVVISTGPSYATKRQENLDTLMQLMKAIPVLGQVAGDLIVSQIDAPIADDLKERLQAVLPPQIKQGEQQIPPQVQQQVQQQAQMIQALTQELGAATAKNATVKMDLEAKERIAIIQAQAGILEAALKTGSQESIALLGHQMNMLNMRWNQDEGNMPIAGGPPAQAPQPAPAMAGAPQPGPTGPSNAGLPAGGDLNA